MKSVYLLGLFLLSFAFAGCADPASDAPEADEQRADWNGKLFAYRASSVVHHWERGPDEFPDTHELLVVPSPYAPMAPDVCSVVAPVALDIDVTCRVQEAAEWSVPKQVEYGCNGSPMAWFDGTEPQQYEAPWALAIEWRNGPTPNTGTAEELLAAWSAEVGYTGDAGQTAHWNGTVSPCFSAFHTDRLVPPFQTFLDWRWEARNHTVLESASMSPESLRTGPGACLLVVVEATVDEFGYSLTLRHGDDVVWESNEPMDPSRQHAEPMPMKVFAMDDVQPGQRYHVDIDHNEVPPPAADVADTVLRVRAIEVNGPPCAPASLDLMV